MPSARNSVLFTQRAIPGSVVVRYETSNIGASSACPNISYQSGLGGLNEEGLRHSDPDLWSAPLFIACGYHLKDSTPHPVHPVLLASLLVLDLAEEPFNPRVSSSTKGYEAPALVIRTSRVC